MVLTLKELGLKYGTDKATTNSDYIGWYENHFHTLRHRKITLLEIGVGEGASLKMWEEYFDHPKTEIWGLDNNLNCLKYNSGKVFVLIGDQNNIQEFVRMNNKFLSEIDIVIDDGSHLMSHQIQTFTWLFPKIKETGIYVVEDLHTSSNLIYPNHKDWKITMVDFIKTFIDAVNMTSSDLYGYGNVKETIKQTLKMGGQFTPLESLLGQLHMYKGICFLYRR